MKGGVLTNRHQEVVLADEDDDGDAQGQNPAQHDIAGATALKHEQSRSSCKICGVLLLVPYLPGTV